VRKATLPLDLVLLTRDRIQEVVDDAVQRGRMTRQDASNLVLELVARSRRQTDELLSDLEQLLGIAQGDEVEDGVRARSVERVRREVDRARRATGIAADLPLPDYDELTAAQVIERLKALSDSDLRLVRDHERRNANRKTVLAAAEQRLRA